jgi:cytochrome c553
VRTAIYTVLVSVLFMSSAWAATVASKTKTNEGKQSKQVSVPVPRQGDPVIGRDKADSERCIECHGLDGQGAGHPNGPEGKFAKLAAQSPAYVLKQIQDFRSGARKHDQMAIMARSVEDEDVRDIAAYFASLPAMKGDGGGEVHEVGKKLFLQGDPARGVVACASCHGDKGQGISSTPLVPRLAGQEWRYLEKQLLEWRSGERRNSPDGVMNAVVKPLTDAEVASLINYLSGL